MPHPLLAMYYDFAVVVGTGNTVDNPKEEDLELTKGVIHRIEVEFPRGCRGYVHLELLHREHRVWPTNREGDFAGEGYTIPIDEHYKLTSEPYALKARAWGVDCGYPHTITVRIGVLPEAVLSPLAGVGSMLKKFFKLMGVGG
ncbi:hypothetical protein ES708_24387 [subsurface metagenome]